MTQYYVVDSKRSTELQKQLLQNSNLKMNIHVMPFDALFYKEKIERNVDRLLIYESVLKMKLDLLSDIIAYPAQFESFEKFVKELHQYGIPLNDLPEENDYDKEIKRVLKRMALKLETVEGTLHYVSESMNHSQTHYLKNTDAHVYEVAPVTLNQISFKSALNFRQELEGAIQYIIEHRLEDITLVVPSVENAWPFLKSMFDRYDIPYTSNNRNTIAKYQYLAYLNYLMDPSTETILELIRSNLLKLKNQDALLQYIEHYQLSIFDLFNPFNYAEKNDDLWEVQELIAVQDLIQEDAAILHQFLNKLEVSTLVENVVYGLSLLDPKSSTSLRNYIQTVIHYLNVDNLKLVYHTLSSMNVGTQVNGSITLCDYHNLPIQPVESMIVLGLTAKNFPAISPNTGILDESYRSRIQGYPSLETRNQFELDKKNLIFNKSKNLILSYYHITYEGKAQECAFEVRNRVDKYNLKEIPWTIIESNPFMAERKKLDPPVAKALYLKDGILNTSVSALEKYVADPYLYFVENGLGLRKPFDFKLDSRIVGTISHDVIERFMNADGEDLYRLWDAYKPYFPLNDAYLPYLIDMNKEILQEHLDYLAANYEASPFALYQQEMRFDKIEIVEKMTLKGFVDRVDINEDAFIIIDYKSSNHSMGTSQVLEGSQLQLPIYAIALRKLLNKPIFGFYYYSFNKKTTEGKDWSHARTKGISMYTDAVKDDYLKEFQFSGWTFLDPEVFDIPITFYKGLYEDKNGFRKVFGKAYDMDLLQEMTQRILSHLKDKITEGILEVDEIELPLVKDFNFKEVKQDD